MKKRLAAYATVFVMFSVLAVCASSAPQKTSAPAKKAPAEKSPPDTITFTGVKDLGTLKDGAYEANGFYTKASYRSYAFQKRGSALTGYAADSGGVWCFQATFAGMVIRPSNVVNWDDQYDEHGRQTGKYDFSPLKDYQKSEFVSARITDEIRTFPMRRIGWITVHPDIVARDERWMKGCLKYYSEPHAQVEQSEPEEPAPCDDEQLRPTMKTAGQWPTYLSMYPHMICVVKGDANCTVENVFQLLIENPAAIGPAKDPRPRPLEDCSVLVLDSFLNLMLPKNEQRPEYDNRIKVHIDEEHHRVTNYTLPGHVFWPGQVIREVVLENGVVGVKTTGYGHEGIIKKWGVNLLTGGLVWSFCDGVLTGVYQRTYGDESSDEK